MYYGQRSFLLKELNRKRENNFFIRNNLSKEIDVLGGHTKWKLIWVFQLLFSFPTIITFKF